MRRESKVANADTHAMTPSERKPWERQIGEPRSKYERFLAFLDLGMHRTLRDAYEHHYGGLQGSVGGAKKRSSLGHWVRDSKRWRWRDRAAKWDIARLTAEGERIAAETARQSAEAAIKAFKEKHRLVENPKTFRDVLHNFTALGELLPPGAIQALCRNAR